MFNYRSIIYYSFHPFIQLVRFFQVPSGYEKYKQGRVSVRRQYNVLGATKKVQTDFLYLEKKVTIFYPECWRRCSIEGGISGY